MEISHSGKHSMWQNILFTNINIYLSVSLTLTFEEGQALNAYIRCHDK